jgi:hypothetical protein
MGWLTGVPCVIEPAGALGSDDACSMPGDTFSGFTAGLGEVWMLMSGGG